jgi:hypothetical protein
MGPSGLAIGKQQKSHSKQTHQQTRKISSTRKTVRQQTDQFAEQQTAARLTQSANSSKISAIR